MKKVFNFVLSLLLYFIFIFVYIFLGFEGFMSYILVLFFISIKIYMTLKQVNVLDNLPSSHIKKKFYYFNVIFFASFTLAIVSIQNELDILVNTIFAGIFIISGFINVVLYVLYIIQKRLDNHYIKKIDKDYKKYGRFLCDSYIFWLEDIFKVYALRGTANIISGYQLGSDDCDFQDEDDVLKKLIKHHYLFEHVNSMERGNVNLLVFEINKLLVSKNIDLELTASMILEKDNEQITNRRKEAIFTGNSDIIVINQYLEPFGYSVVIMDDQYKMYLCVLKNDDINKILKEVYCIER